MAHSITAETLNLSGIKEFRRDFINVLSEITEEEKTDLRKRLDTLLAL